ncbi:MAG TPA: cupin domain-containing protein [Chloroflexota bacterium]|jgi:gentisate 1,2-dioxygenase
MASDLEQLDLANLNQWMKDHSLSGSWMRVGVDAEGRPQSRPASNVSGSGAYVTRWADLYPSLLRGGELVSLPYGPMEMRTAGGQPAGAPNRPITMNAQILMPGERTRAHKNSKNETRLVVDAPAEAVFVCDGEAFPMQRGDVVISPTWTDHDHFNPGSKPAVWIDVYDWGYSGLGAELNERFSPDDPYQKITRTDGYSEKTLGQLGPASGRSTSPRPPVRYPWAGTEAALTALRENEEEEDPYEGFQLMFRSPVDGGPTLPTIAWHVQMLPGRRTTRTHRHNSTAFYHVFQGEGVTVVEGERLEWTQGDIFLVPPWTWHSHQNLASEDAILFSVDDWPARKALGFYGEERLP